MPDSEFTSWRDYWTFRESVCSRSRFLRNADVERFLDSVLASSEHHCATWHGTKLLWRAQLGHDWREGLQGEPDKLPVAFPPKRMVPLASGASEGRANPKGIPYLYLATNQDTAMAEVRPWVGSLISLGTFITLRDLRMVQLAPRKRRLRYCIEEPSPEVRESMVWADINEAFATPVSSNDMTADYVPTQILAELLRDNGFDGIAYGSALGTGLNVVLFDITAVELVRCTLCRTESMSFVFKETDNPYFPSAKD